jgi:hypothetical protein
MARSTIIEIRSVFKADNNVGVDYLVGKPQRKIGNEWVTLVNAPDEWDRELDELCITAISRYDTLWTSECGLDSSGMAYFMYAFAV